MAFIEEKDYFPVYFPFYVSENLSRITQQVSSLSNCLVFLMFLIAKAIIIVGMKWLRLTSNWK